MSVLKGSLREVRISGENLAATRTLTARLVSVSLSDTLLGHFRGMPENPDDIKS